MNSTAIVLYDRRVFDKIIVLDFKPKRKKSKNCCIYDPMKATKSRDVTQVLVLPKVPILTKVVISKKK